jgi:WD40 repeat protein
VLSLAFSPDNKLLASGGIDDELFIWSIQEQRIIKAFQHPQKAGSIVSHVNWSHDGTLLSASNTKSVVLFDMRYIQTGLNS